MRATRFKLSELLLPALFVSLLSTVAISAGGTPGKDSNTSGTTTMTAPGFGPGAALPCPWCDPRAARGNNAPKHGLPARDPDTVIVSNGGVLTPNQIVSTTTIQQITPLRAKFQAGPTIGPAPLNVQFIDTSTGNVVGWLWKFGDGTESGLASPLHQYTSPGTYTVSLTVTDGASVSKVTKGNYITAQ